MRYVLLLYLLGGVCVRADEQMQPADAPSGDTCKMPRDDDQPCVGRLAHADGLGPFARAELDEEGFSCGNCGLEAFLFVRVGSAWYRLASPINLTGFYAMSAGEHHTVEFVRFGAEPDGALMVRVEFHVVTYDRRPYRKTSEYDTDVVVRCEVGVDAPRCAGPLGGAPGFAWPPRAWP
jgi:hypothetical protein